MQLITHVHALLQLQFIKLMKHRKIFLPDGQTSSKSSTLIIEFVPKNKIDNCTQSLYYETILSITIFNES